MLAVRNQPNLDLGARVADRHALGREVGADRRSRRPRRSRATRRARPRAARASAGSKARGGATTGYFLSTNGGSVGEGQVFEYDPRDETVKLIYDAPNATDLDNPDNITVTPRGGLLLCEDAAGNNFTEGERLVGLTLARQDVHVRDEQHQPRRGLQRQRPAGDYRQSEWAGACYSPDGRWLFVNIQTPGVTFAITGPWGRGPL